MNEMFNCQNCNAELIVVNRAIRFLLIFPFVLLFSLIGHTIVYLFQIENSEIEMLVTSAMSGLAVAPTILLMRQIKVYENEK